MYPHTDFTNYHDFFEPVLYYVEANFKVKVKAFILRNIQLQRAHTKMVLQLYTCDQEINGLTAIYM